MTWLTDTIERLEIRILESTLGQRALAWYRRLPDRDQFMLQLLAVGCLALMIVGSLALPSSRYALHSLNAYQQARDDVQWLQANEGAARKIAATESRPVDANAMVSSAVNSAKQFGLQFHRYEPTADGDLRIWLEKASFNSLVAWLDALSSEHKLHVDNLTVSPEAVDGLVNARLEIKG